MDSISSGVLFELRRLIRDELGINEILRHLRVCETKLDRLLKHSNIDFSKEDAAVLAATAEVEAATHNIPPRTTPTPNPGE